MNVTIDLKTLGLMLIGIGIIVFIIFLIILTSNLIKTIRKANAMLDDLQVISAIAAKRTEEADGLVDGLAGSVYELIAAVKDQQDIKKAIATVVNIIGSIKNIVGKFTCIGRKEK